jgi:methyl-accepting chemotaxis protein
VVGAVAVSLAATGIKQRESDTRNKLLVRSALVCAVFVIFALWLATRMARVLEAMRDAALRIARGDLSEDVITSNSTDELGHMSRAFAEMTRRLRELQQNAARVAAGDLRVEQQGEGELFAAFRTMVQNLRGLAKGIRDSSHEVASAAAALFAATREHEASATQQTASVEEMCRTLEGLAYAAERVNSDALQVRDMAERSLSSSQQTADQTKLVSAHSDRIGEILTLIQDIADKSDLLALNAALEGTHAGEVGRGFSLVAAEMRRLSEHVMDSVRDIRKLVADMRAASHASVLATEESIKLAKEVAQSSGKITSAVGQQREGTGQVKGAAEEIVRVVNTSLDGTAQITRSAEALLQLSGQLRTSASAFRFEAEP